ncbi:DUF2971 domain-containing protein [Cetobacterium sp.]|uniref:DUF2971 domain-containing protein n=1 Tax=Cetobacterium sp. TaxID=2071632 RepID=UPI003F2E59E2
MWKKNFIENLYPVTVSNHEAHLNAIDYAYELKSENIPEKLFKYNWLDSELSYNIDNFVNNQVYLNKPENFNDIFDCKSYINFKKLIEEKGKKMSKAVLEKIRDKFPHKSFTLRQFLRYEMKSKKNYKKFKKFFQSTIRDELFSMYKDFESLTQKVSRVSCFSEEFNSNLMWSHYANKHSGFVLEYNFKELGYHDIRNRMIYPVIYQEDFFDLTDFFKEYSAENFNNLYLNLPALIKSTDWNYEKEWRLIIGAETYEEGILYNVPIPKAIYLGVRINTVHKELLINIAKSKNVKIYQMKMENNRYGLKCEEI